VPGPSGLDDAIQVVVEIGDQPSPYANSTHTYTLLRDELGTVIGLVAEDEGSDPAKPPVPVRYRYTPYGEVHAESGPELLRARFAADATTVDAGGTEVTQHVADDAAAAAGAMVLDWSLPLAAGTLPAGLHVERLVTGSGWVQVDAGELAIGPQPSSAGTIGSGGSLPRLLVMTRSGWTRGVSYRVRLTPELADEVGRAFVGTKSLEWRIPAAAATGPTPAVVFDERQAADFESWRAAGDAVGGRFPGGQTALFQGLWTDPVTGMAYARARWYDARNASWLQEDPVGETDSTNLYAFVGWQPNMGIDPMGLSALSSATDAVHSMCEAAGGDCSGFDAEQTWNVTKAAGEGLWQGAKGAAVGTVQGLWTLAKVTATEGPGAAAKMMADATLDGIVNAPENLLNWLEYMNNATPEQAAKEFGRLAGGAAVSALGPAAVGKVLGVGGKLARFGLGKAGAALANLADEVPQRALRRAAEKLEELPCSFAAGTPVVTPEGLVPIEDVETGDFVRAYDEETGYESLGEVLGLSRRQVGELWLLTVDGDAIEASEEHPFYVVGKGWVQTRELAVGDEFVAERGERVRLENIERIQQPGTVYNFEVDGLHDYFVGEVGVLGHNCPIKWKSPGALAPMAGTAPGRKYVTYTAPDLDNPGKFYAGRASGPANWTPEQILNRRKAGHHRNLGPLELDDVTSSYRAVRGREHLVRQRLERLGLGTDQINPIGPRNKRKLTYLKTAIKEFGRPW
jgi:RHS repeat-associated protein